MKQIEWTASALSDLTQIHEYINRDKPAIAADVAHQIYQSVDPLKHNPLIGRTGRVGGTRELILGKLPYILMYELRGEIIFIKRVVHTSRLWPK